MIENKRVYTVISAAGSGRRMGAPIPKQFIVNRGRTILEQTVERFAGNNMVDNDTVFNRIYTHFIPPPEV